jgi:hypothetical protein
MTAMSSMITTHSRGVLHKAASVENTDLNFTDCDTEHHLFGVAQGP